MKHIDGETLESIIAKLAAGDPEYCARYTIDARVEIFLGLLHALQCAHNKDIVHRDIKPANVMVGRFGEVVLMDWGSLSRSSRRAPRPLPAFADAARPDRRHPAYMSPEQASGNNIEVDARSDLYSASVLFHELLAVRHYLSHCRNVTQTLFSVLGKTSRYNPADLHQAPLHPVPPAEHLHFIAKGLGQGSRGSPPERRRDDLGAAARARDGLCRVSCPATLAKRMINTTGRFVSRFPKLSPFVLLSAAAAYRLRRDHCAPACALRLVASAAAIKTHKDRGRHARRSPGWQSIAAPRSTRPQPSCVTVGMGGVPTIPWPADRRSRR